MFSYQKPVILFISETKSSYWPTESLTGAFFRLTFE
jgi:hypothetical protein